MYSEKFLKEHGLEWDGFGIPFNPDLNDKARELREELTASQKQLWDDFLKDFMPKFLTHVVLDNYILTFYCSKRKVAIEIDGSYKQSQGGTMFVKISPDSLKRYDIKVIKFTSKEVLSNFNLVKNTIYKELDRKI